MWISISCCHFRFVYITCITNYRQCDLAVQIVSHYAPIEVSSCIHKALIVTLRITSLRMQNKRFVGFPVLLRRGLTRFTVCNSRKLNKLILTCKTTEHFHKMSFGHSRCLFTKIRRLFLHCLFWCLAIIKHARI